jgi:hypothetical protein
MIISDITHRKEWGAGNITIPHFLISSTQDNSGEIICHMEFAIWNSPD